MKEGRKSLITFGNARVIKGRKKKNKSLLMLHRIIINENKTTEIIPRTLKPGYWNNGELNELMMQIKLKV
tara:strand:+ start:145 stop:354 length:210 start_codon:yes stop_codon:yes gene_type:complete